MNGWKSIPVGDLVESVKTWNPSRAEPNEVFDYIDLSALDSSSKLIVGARPVLCKEAPSRARQLVSTGDVLVSTVRPNLNGVARVTSGLDGATASTGFCVVRTRSDLLDGGYFFQWIRSPQFVNDMVKKATGASYPAVSDRIIFESLIPCPSLLEQRRIASILDQTDALRVKRREALTQLDKLTQAIFIEMFGSTNNFKFATGGVRPFVEASSGKSSKTVLSMDKTNIPIYGGNGINGWAVSALYEQPVLVFGRVGQYCGNAVITKGPSWVTDNAIVIRISDVSKLNEIYVLHAFSGSNFSSRVKHLDLPFINQSIILDNPIPLPPLHLQQIFSARIENIEALKTSNRAALSELDALFASLQHRAFNGQL